MPSNHFPPDQPPEKHPDSYKFLLRSLDINSNINAFKNCCVKGFYLRKVIACSIDYTVFFSKNKMAFSQVFTNKKIHKTVHEAEIRSNFPHFVHKCLKISKCLQKYTLEHCANSRFSLPFPFRQLPAKIQQITFSVNQGHGETTSRKDIYHIARSIRRFPHLQCFQRGTFNHKDKFRGYVQKELALYSRSVARLQNLKRMIYCVTENEYYRLHRIMRRGVVHQGITGLELFFGPEEDSKEMRALLSNDDEEEPFIDLASEEVCQRAFMNDEDEYQFVPFENMAPLQQEIYKRLKNEIEEEYKDKDIKAEEDAIEWPMKTLPDKIDFANVKSAGEEQEINRKFWALCRMTEKLRPFYRFELFPDLKELTVEFKGFGFPLGYFVIDGFCALTNLQNLKITFQRRGIGMVYLFKAFLELPFLRKFALSTRSLNNEEWALLGHFVDKQNKIEELDLNVKKGFSNKPYYLRQNDHLKRTLKRLKSQQSIRSLNLDCPYFSLEIVSEGLSHLKMMNQLHTFKFRASDDILTSQKKTLERVAGLCQFLKDHKKSLKIFHITLKLAVEDILVTQIAEAVCHLSELKEFYFVCNWHSAKRLEYFTETLQKDVALDLRKKLVLPKKWNPSLAQYFQKLANLERFFFLSQIRSTGENDPVRWIIDLISILPNLERLKNLKFYFAPFGDESFKKAMPMLESFKKAMPMLINSFLCIPRIKKISVTFYGSEKEELDLKEICENINQRQALKSDFMFD